MAHKETVLMGDVVISRLDRDNPVIEIRIQDKTSRVTFVEAHLTLEQFAYAVTGMHTPDVKLVCRDLAYVGRQKLSRTEIVEFTGRKNSGYTDEEKLEFCKPVMRRLKKETGLKWTPHLSDLGNYHKAVKGEKDLFRVIFTAHEKREK